MAPNMAPAVEAIESATMRRVGRRLIPLLMICYFAAYLDRVNVCFAALTMNKALGLSAAIFGIGSGIFFLGYFLFEVPSNLILEKVGARRWIARILITWGIISGITAFVNTLTSVRLDNMPTCGIFAVTSLAAQWNEFLTAGTTFWFFDYPKREG